MESGYKRRMEDEGSSFLGETKVNETFNGDYVCSKEKSTGSFNVVHEGIIGRILRRLIRKGRPLRR